MFPDSQIPVFHSQGFHRFHRDAFKTNGLIHALFPLSWISSYHEIKSVAKSFASDASFRATQVHRDEALIARVQRALQGGFERGNETRDSVKKQQMRQIFVVVEAETTRGLLFVGLLFKIARVRWDRIIRRPV